MSQCFRRVVAKYRQLLIIIMVLMSFLGWTFLEKHHMHGNGASMENRFNDDPISNRFEQRFKLLHNHCNKKFYYNQTSFGRNQNIIVNEKHNLAVCVVPKSGSSSWHYLMWRMRMKDMGIEVLDSEYTSRETLINQFSTYNIKNHSKFTRWRPGVDDDFYDRHPPDTLSRIILARHPFARLISAWNQKMNVNHETANGFLNSYPEMKEYRSFPIDESHVISWEDFAAYVSEIRPRKLDMNYHFLPAMELCGKCVHPYKYVIKLETVDEDFSWLARRINLTVNLGHNGKSSNQNALRHQNMYDIINDYMKRVPRDVISRLHQLYSDDFLYFGYYFNIDFNEAGSLT